MSWERTCTANRGRRIKVMRRSVKKNIMKETVIYFDDCQFCPTSFENFTFFLFWGITFLVFVGVAPSTASDLLCPSNIS